MAWILKTVIVLVGVFLSIKSKSYFNAPPLPKIEETWWGPGAPKQEDTTVRPFKIKVSDEILKDLQFRLNTTRPFTPPLEGINEEYGMNTNQLKDILKAWRDNYNWREREKFLNQFSQYLTNIQGLDIHFIHVKPKTAQKTLPLILLHGWPSSVRDFYKIIPLLTTYNEKYGFAFEVVIPSLPGYGFSSPSQKPGMGAPDIALILKNLMFRLGFSKFYIHGGDWGAIITKNMATLFPDHVLGIHSTMMYSRRTLSVFKILLGTIYPGWVVSKEYENRMYPLSEKISILIRESGYFHMQATKPDTVGVALGESPMGLAAYILEKFSLATQEGLKKYTNEELIDNLMYYWVTNSMTTAMRIYKESSSPQQAALEQIPVSENVPCAAANFPYEIVYQPDWILKDKFPNLIQSTTFKRGGHFAVLEEPELVASDLFQAVSKMEIFHAEQKLN